MSFTSPPALRPLALSIRRCVAPPRQQGFGLLGIICVMALSSAVLGVAYTSYRQNKRASDVVEAAQSAKLIAQRVMSSYASAADFSGLSTAQAIHDGLIPGEMVWGGNAHNVWQGSIQVAPLSLDGTGTDNGFALTYENVDPETCASFAVNAGRGFYDVKINGASALGGHEVTMPKAVALCSGNAGTAVVQLIQAKATPDSLVGAPVACVQPPPQTRQANCPGGQASSVPPYSIQGITEKRTGVCASPYGSVVWSPWTPIVNTCAPTCNAPPPSAEECTGHPVAKCPPGTQTPDGKTSFNQSRFRTVTYSCASPSGPFTQTTGAWGAFGPDPSDFCQPVTDPSDPSPTYRYKWKVTGAANGGVTTTPENAVIVQVCEPHAYNDPDPGSLSQCRSAIVGQAGHCYKQDQWGNVYDMQDLTCQRCDGAGQHCSN